MRVLALLLCLVTAIRANVEKTVFLAPPPSPPSVVQSALGFQLHSLSPLSMIYPTQLAVTFPSASLPQGQESWYLLRGLVQGHRYEVRVCWPAIQPTDFWLDTFTLDEVANNSRLARSPINHSRQQQDLALPAKRLSTEETVLFLRIQAAASYFSLNQTLMFHPEPVHVDIILDPYILNVLPQTLAPFAVYVTFVGIGAWFLSGYIYRWLLSIAVEPLARPHME